MKVPIRFTRMTVSNGSKACAPLRPATFSAQPMPGAADGDAQPVVARRGRDGGLDLLRVGDVGGDEARAELVGQRLRRARG